MYKTHLRETGYVNLGGLSLFELLRRTVRESWHDAVFGHAGRMAFYQFLAIFPALLMLHIATEHMLHLGPEVQRSFLQGAGKILPGEIVNTVRSVVDDIAKVQLPGWRFLTSFAGALWAGCNGTWAMIYGLNAAYEVTERRRPLALVGTIAGLTAALALLTALAISVVAAMSGMGAQASLGFLEFLVLVVVLLFWFSVLYRFAPSLRDKRWQWSTPGALLAAALWLAATFGTRIYFAHATNYHLAYGRLSGVAMLLLWLYVTDGAILIGGEMNSEIEKAVQHKQSARPLA